MILADEVTTVGTDVWSVLESWIFTPAGAALTLLLIFTGGAMMIFRMLGRSVRFLSIAVKIVAILFFIWVVGGVLEAFGLPIRETLARIGGVLMEHLPDVVGSFMEFLSQLFVVAGQ